MRISICFSINSVASLTALNPSLLQTQNHALYTLGTLPWLISSIYPLTSVTSRLPFKTRSLILFGFTLVNIFFLIRSTWLTNSGLSWLLSSSSNFCNFHYSSTGRTIISQSRSLKNYLSLLLILFLFQIVSDDPDKYSSAFYRY